MRFYLETERLILRNLVPEDFREVFLWCGDPDVARYMVYPVYTRAEDVRDWIESLDRRVQSPEGPVGKRIRRRNDPGAPGSHPEPS